MRCFDKLNMTRGWYGMLRQAQHDSGLIMGWLARKRGDFFRPYIGL